MSSPRKRTHSSRDDTSSKPSATERIRPIGSADIQRYAGPYARDEDVDAVFVVTSNWFTSGAKTVAANRDMTLINADKL
jgi:Restriction endonuclease.